MLTIQRDRRPHLVFLRIFEDFSDVISSQDTSLNVINTMLVLISLRLTYGNDIEETHVGGGCFV